MKSILILATITSSATLSHFHPFPTSVALCGSSPLHNQHQHRTKLSTNNQTIHYNLPLFTFYFQQHRKQILPLSTYSIGSPSYHSNHQVFLCANDKFCTAYAFY